MTNSPPRLLSLVMVPAVITLVVTMLRVVGELQGWSNLWVGTRRGGGEGGLLAITWLVPLFGLWFGLRLQRGGVGVANRGRALLLGLVAIVVFAGCMAGLAAAGLIVFPDEQHPVAPRGVAYMAASMLLAVIFSFVAWPRVAFTLLVYAVFARIPVIVVTWFAIDRGWDVHYAKMAPGFIAPPHEELFFNLMMPQVTFWPVFTILVGTLTACLGAMLAGGGKRG